MWMQSVDRDVHLLINFDYISCMSTSQGGQLYSMEMVMCLNKLMSMKWICS